MGKSFKIKAPSKSALCSFRKKISFNFFRDIYNKQVKKFTHQMKTYKGYHIVGMDGDAYDVRPTKDMLKKGYRGCQVMTKNDEGKKETHYLKMYVVRCVDLLSGVILDFRESPKNDEIGKAVEMIKSLPSRTMAIFDRLYLTKRIIEASVENSTFFFARCKSGSTFKEIIEFYKSNKYRDYFFYTVNGNKKINLVKVVNPNAKGKNRFTVLATNADISKWTSKEVANLYTLRWDCETNNRDSTSTLKIEQWHSEFHNGILQEIYDKANYFL